MPKILIPSNINIITLALLSVFQNDDINIIASRMISENSLGFLRWFLSLGSNPPGFAVKLLFLNHLNYFLSGYASHSIHSEVSLFHLLSI